MPKTSTFPVCFDEVEQVTITSLRRLGFLKPDRLVNGPYVCIRDGKLSGSINVIANLDERWIELDYVYGERHINYRVRLESLPKNLGGFEWYFICPATGRRCRKLYGIGERFLSRFAHHSVKYRTQIESKGYRDLFAAYTKMIRIREHVSKRHARTTYNGRPTKRYRRLLERFDRIDVTRLERFRET